MSFDAAQLAEDTNKLEMTGEEAVGLWQAMHAVAQGTSSVVFRDRYTASAPQVD